MNLLNIKTTAIILLLISTPTLLIAETPDCHVPNKKNINDFFRGENHWTEVKSIDSKELEPNKTLEIRINFEAPWESQFFKAKNNMGTISSLCLERNQTTLHIVSGSRNIILEKHKNGAIESKITFIGFTFVYYYRPNVEVINNQPHNTDEVLNWVTFPK